MTDPVRLTLAHVHTLAFDVLRANGVSEAHARTIAETVTAAERLCTVCSRSLARVRSRSAGALSRQAARASATICSARAF